MNNEIIIQDLVEKIISIEQENMESADAENNDIRGRIVNSILSELDKVVNNDED
ncbi:MAG: hypothetical protein AB7Y74_13505 [Syntrophorhabdus sp.]